MPTGTTAQRPTVAANGTFRYNTDTSKFELYQKIHLLVMEVH